MQFIHDPEEVGILASLDKIVIDFLLLKLNNNFNYKESFLDIL